jgi:regulatory protein
VHEFDDTPAKLRKRLTPTEALARIFKYCAYQERSHREVKRRLYDYGLKAEEVEEIITKLISEGFVNESRYARAFAGGKFRMKKWGRIKIENELKANGVSKNCIALGLKEIDNTAYRKTVRDLIVKKLKQETEKNPFKLKNKVARFIIGKGYEPDMVWEMLKDTGE